MPSTKTKPQKTAPPDRLATAETSVSTDTSTTTASSYESIPNVAYAKTSHYYTSHKRFEQSVDVYRPTENDVSKGVVALVVGSGWLGHQPYVYWGTSWWNSSLPQQISSLGYTCVVIRHSGGFPRIADCSWATVMTMLLVVHLAVYGTLKYFDFPVDDGDNDDSDDVFRNQMVISIFGALIFYIFLYWQGKGAVMLKDMLDDVSTALKHVDQHIFDWHKKYKDTKDDKDDGNDDKLPIIFGGYSSGGHVASTLLSTPTLTPLGGKYTATVLHNMDIQHILYVSGFMGVSPKDIVTTLLTLVVLNEWPSNIPSPIEDLKARVGVKKTRSRRQSLPLPKHTLIGCQNEVFGLPILDSAFCSAEYAATMNAQEEGSAEWIPLKEWTCNHWSVLSTMALRKALHESLGKVFGDDEDDDDDED